MLVHTYSAMVSNLGSRAHWAEGIEEPGCWILQTSCPLRQRNREGRGPQGFSAAEDMVAETRGWSPAWGRCARGALAGRQLQDTRELEGTSRADW